MSTPAGRPTARLFHSMLWHARVLPLPGEFSFDGARHRYFYHPYNATWGSERCVEIPLARRVLAESGGRRVLEVGNVMQHYGPIDHDVVDKYEAGQGVRNVDVMDIDPSDHYDLVLSISTLEHVGWDEEPFEPDKAIRAVRRLMDLVSAGGRLFVTIPRGWNRFLDRAVDRSELSFSRVHHLKRVSRHVWREARASEMTGVYYGVPYKAANALTVAYFDKPG